VILRAAVAVSVVLLMATPPAKAQDPAADAHVVGVVVGGDGQPAGRVPVDVDYDVDNPFGLAFGVVTLGFGCLVPDLCTTGRNEVGDLTTDTRGRYDGLLPGSYVAGTETDTDWHVTAGRPPRGSQLAGPTSTFEFEVNIAVQEAPPLPLWEAEPAVQVEGWHATASVAGPPAGLAQPSITVATASGLGRTLAGLTTTVDLRSLELGGSNRSTPVFTSATALADVRVPHANGRTIYHQAASTPTMPVTDVELVPPSRGAPCSIARTDGSTEELGTCGVTDGTGGGILYDPRVPDGGTAVPPASITVAAVGAIELADVFVYGCDAGCVVEASGDGTTWGRLTNDLASSELAPSFPTDRYLVASFRPPLPARFVRVTRADGVSVSEISAWPAVPPEPLPPAVSPPGADAGDDVAASDGGEEDGDDIGIGLLVVAVLVLVLSAAGIGVVAGRRTTPSRE